jgi:purine nucleosidase
MTLQYADMAMNPPCPVLLDTDVGTDVDDAIAIALTLASPEIDLRAVTIVSGDTQLRGRIAKKLLTLGGRPQVHVAAGVREPVLRQRNFLWLGHEGQRIVNSDEELHLANSHAVDLLIDTVLRERPHVVAIGPLSNLAVAIMKEPAVITSVPHLTVMGGLLHCDPDMPLLDYNLGSDAEAAMVVLSAGIPTTLVPVDVTCKVFLTAADLARLRGAGSQLVQMLCDAIEIWTPLQRALSSFQPEAVAFLHDPLTMAVLIEPSLVTFERLRLRPAIVDGNFKLISDPGAPQLEFATAVDAHRFTEFLLDRLLRLG